jgi:hypothetical protein
MAAGTEEITKFIMLATEAVGRVMSPEAPHTSDPSFDAAMILFKAVVQVGAGPVPHRLPQHAADCPEVGAMAVSGHPIWTKPLVALAERKKA